MKYLVVEAAFVASALLVLPLTAFEAETTRNIKRNCSGAAK
jgi:hypothetical protein